jgi:hypothetical protein
VGDEVAPEGEADLAATGRAAAGFGPASDAAGIGITEPQSLHRPLRPASEASTEYDFWQKGHENWIFMTGPGRG